jgi:hypothetical protein
MISLGLDDQTDIGVAVGLVSTSRLIGGAIAGAIYTSIYTQRYATAISAKISAAAAASGFTGSLPELIKASATNTAAAYNKVPGITENVIAACRLAVKYAYTDAFSLVYQVAIAFGGLGIMAALCTRTVDVRKKSNDRAVVLENEKKVLEDVETKAQS